MVDGQNKAAEYRREAASCFEAARRISLRDHRERVLEMAEHLLALAEEAEAEERR
jgi:hypothetical protein